MKRPVALIKVQTQRMPARLDYRAPLNSVAGHERQGHRLCTCGPLGVAVRHLPRLQLARI
eukprot:7032357-Prymnesium_polylepis.1